ncbi:CHASE2 domain-containing protein [Reichenbachiella versicolor]|uniref:CHASE2 domain-containing protein n=1 Tax=Reichenbachiella versicolor TaxID=1821036 RepID=UPI000D6E3359|nr:CHASE2 domain-containing protein [Reichenbachiella versicolor]
MFKKFWLDTIWSFIFIIAVALLVTTVTQFKLFDIFDPFGDALKDMETTDIVFGQGLRPDQVAEENIVLVNIGDLPRRGIADLVNAINSHNPKVIGMDMIFPYPKEDTLGDLYLANALSQVENLVMYSKLLNVDDDDTFDSLEVSDQSLFGYGETAFTNFITGAADQDDPKVCRSFAPSEQVGDEIELAFSVKLASYFAPEKTEKFLARDNDIEFINYKGNIFDLSADAASRAPITYFALDWYQVLDGEFVPELIEDKIIIFCYMGSQLGDRKALDDKYFTPLNFRYAGKSHADMFGGVIHANCVSMILSEEYIDEMGTGISYIWALILLYMNIILFVYIYKVMPKWYDGLTKVIQLIEAFALFTLVIVVFNQMNYKLDMTAAIVAVLIAGDALEIYFGVVKNLFTKEGRRDLTRIKKL